MRSTLLQCSRDDVSTKLNKAIEDVPAVHIGNPKTLEFQVSISNVKIFVVKFFLQQFPTRLVDKFLNSMNALRFL